MIQKLLQLYCIANDDETLTYRLDWSAPLNATVLATYNSIYDIAGIGVIPDQNNVITTNHLAVDNNIGSSTQYYTRTLSDEGRQRISESSKRQAGEGNSQFGTRWIHSLIKKKSKRIRATDDLPKGWLEGRKMKFKD